MLPCTDADAALEAIVTLFTNSIPGRFQAIYLTGSWANHSAVAHRAGNEELASDFDLHLIVAHPLTPMEREQLDRCEQAATEICGIRLDLAVTTVEGLSGYWDVSLKHSGRLLFGTEFRDQVTPPTPLAHLQRAMTFPPYDMAALRGQKWWLTEPKLVYPLTEPNPSDLFRGYAPGSLRLVVSLVTWSATVLLATRGVLVGTKREAVRQYQNQIGDQWSDLITEIYQWGKEHQQLCIPQTREGRRQLERLCHRLLGLENHLLATYYPYLMAWQQQVEHQAFAEKLLGIVHYATPPAGSG